MPIPYVRSYEEEKGARFRLVREAPIASINTVANSITISAGDWRRELTPGDSLRIAKSSANGGEYTVVSVKLNGANSEIILSGTALVQAAAPGGICTMPKSIEDYFIDLDQQETLAGAPKLRTLVNSFISGVAAIVNGRTAHAALLAKVDDFGPQILRRARALSCDDRTRADDYACALYWSRLRMMVALKSHAYCLSSRFGRNALVDELDLKSRGYDLDFAAAPIGARKVLITGFDPYHLASNPEGVNPSGSNALALHGTTITSSGKDAYIETAIFPVRYRDFDAGRVEALVDPLLNGPRQVAMIMTVSQNGNSPVYDLERFAGRRRGGGADNEFNTSEPAQLGNATHAAYYETTLPSAAMIPGPFLAPPNVAQRLFFDQSYDAERRASLHPLAGGDNTNLPSVAPPPGSLLSGSGGDYLSNEIFYRVAHRREQLASATLTGHFHIPDAANAKVGIEAVISEVENAIKRWLDSLP